MPKVPTVQNNHSPGSSPFTNGQGNHPNVLKRNQACHQCRRRKLKCDAKRPCSTCVRSHAHAVTHAPPGTQLPPEPECTFDEVAETTSVIAEPPKNRYEKLESRISELEALLLQKDEGTKETPAQVDIVAPAGAQRLSPLATNGGVLTPDNITVSSSFSLPTSPDSNLLKSSSSQQSVDGHTVSPPAYAFITNATPSPSNDPAGINILYDSGLMWHAWPSNLPNYDLLHYLVETFFSFFPNSSRLFHIPSFMTSLTYPPHHPKFPIAPVLHAICAMASMYTGAVSKPPPPDLSQVPPDEIFQKRYREKTSDSFAEQQARYAMETMLEYEDVGQELLQVIQSGVVLSQYLWFHARWVEMYRTTAHMLRVCGPTGLNMCPPFLSISKVWRPSSILLPPSSILEDELRRNVFWLSYAVDRYCGCGNAWAHSLDDQDVSQLMPLRGDLFVQGVQIPAQERQWAWSHDILLTHPEAQTDPFILYVKGAMLISRVKTFNHRFRTTYYAGDAKAFSQLNFSGDSDPVLEFVDPRTSSAFIEIDNILSTFRASFPGHLKDSVTSGVVDNHLYVASLVPHVATVLLHEPHANVRRSGCTSALKILTAARSVLDLIYLVWSTSYDISLLDPFSAFAWFLSGRIIVRFMQAAMEAQSPEQMSTLQTEYSFIRLALKKQGERIPLSYRYTKMLEDFAIRHCGHIPVIEDFGIASLSPVSPPAGTKLQTPTTQVAEATFLYDFTESAASEGFVTEVQTSHTEVVVNQLS